MKEAAEQGDAEAQYRLGLAHAEGKGAPQDHRAAAKWYRLAAEQGHAGAQFQLGGSYVFGKGVPQDYSEAVKWYRLAAERRAAQQEATRRWQAIEVKQTPAP